jgi:hypothetical protein
MSEGAAVRRGDARGGHPYTLAPQIPSDGFHCIGGVPKNGMQILGNTGDIKEPQVVKIPMFSRAEPNLEGGVAP